MPRKGRQNADTAFCSKGGAPGSGVPGGGDVPLPARAGAGSEPYAVEQPDAPLYYARAHLVAVAHVPCVHHGIKSHEAVAGAVHRSYASHVGYGGELERRTLPVAAYQKPCAREDNQLRRGREVQQPFAAEREVVGVTCSYGHVEHGKFRARKAGDGAVARGELPCKGRHRGKPCAAAAPLFLRPRENRREREPAAVERVIGVGLEQLHLHVSRAHVVVFPAVFGFASESVGRGIGEVYAHAVAVGAESKGVVLVLAVEFGGVDRETERKAAVAYVCAHGRAYVGFQHRAIRHALEFALGVEVGALHGCAQFHRPLLFGQSDVYRVVFGGHAFAARGEYAVHAFHKTALRPGRQSRSAKNKSCEYFLAVTGKACMLPGQTNADSIFPESCRTGRFCRCGGRIALLWAIFRTGESMFLCSRYCRRA